MASIVLGVVGAGIGSLFGAPTLGWSIGSAIGGAMDAPGGPNTVQEGPRITDLKVQYSTWGNTIPVTYGINRMSGNIIWSSQIRETQVTNTVSSGGKGGGGGGSSTTITYSYSADFAVALCQGPIMGVRRIWVFGELVYNAGTSADPMTIVASNSTSESINFYLGNETQLPNSTIEADKGIGNVPAYRGMAYVVFKNFNLDKYGARIPNIEFEVLTSGSSGFPSVYNYSTDFSSGIGRSGAHTTKNTVLRGNYIQSILTTATGGPPYIYNIDTILYDFNMNVVSKYYLHRSSADTTGTLNPSLCNSISDMPTNAFTMVLREYNTASWDNTTLFRWCSFDSKNGRRLYASDRVLAFASTQFYQDGTGNSWYGQSCHNYKGIILFIGKSTNNNLWLGINKCDENGCPNDNILPVELKVSWDVDLSIGFPKIYADPSGYFYVLFSNLIATGTSTLYKLSIDSTYNLSIVNTWTANFSIGTSGGYGHPYFNVQDDILVTGETYFNSHNSAIYQLVGASIIPHPSGSSISGYLDICPNYCGSKLIVGVSPSNNKKTVALMPTISTNMVSLSSVVADLLNKCNLNGTLIDISALSGINITGYTVSRLSDARTILSQLAEAFSFIVVESGGIIKIVLLSDPSIASIINTDDFINSQGIYITAKRVQEVDLPKTIAINYMNSNADYVVSTEQQSRLITSSIDTKIIELPVSMTPDQAVQLVNAILFQSHVNRTQFTFSTSKKYTYLEPGDTVQIYGGVAQNILCRLVSKNEDLQGNIQFTAMADNAAVYSQTAISGATNAVQSSIITLPSPTTIIPLDIPILRTIDDIDGIYIAVGNMQSTWNGCTIFYSTDDVTYNEVGSVFSSATFGMSTNTLGDWPYNNLIDEVNTVTVSLDTYGSTLVSHVYPDFMSTNIALIGDEIISFRDAVLVSPGVYTLSGLVRGLKDTGKYKSTHTSYDRFVLFSTSSGLLRVTQISHGNDLYIKAVTFGLDISNAPSILVTNTGIGMKPFTPINISIAPLATGDLIFNWERQSRYTTLWDNGIDSELGEAIEQYTIEVYDNTFTTLKNTINVTQTKTYTYTNAQQIIDFGTIPSHLGIKVYQVSSVIGTGSFGTLVY